MAGIKNIGVVGAGQMGAGIVMVSALAGHRTLLWDANPDSITKGLALIKSLLHKMVEKNKLSTADQGATLNRIEATTTLEAFRECDLAIEAIVENLALKTALFTQLDKICPAHAYLASNTSSISITKLAASTKRPEQFIGLHFMNPVPIMKLVEIIRGLQTNELTYTTTQQLMSAWGKTTVLGVDTPGFIVNRILVPMVNEAIYLLQQGVKAEDIDTAMKLGTNQPMGPLELADFVGLDTLLYILRVLHAEIGEDKYRPCPLLINYVDAGWYGRKSGRGFYFYER